jgi:uncharacterized membrane protein YebE (DUF533 family)
MFDARSILDTLVRGGSQPGGAQGQQPDSGILQDLLGQLGSQGGASGNLQDVLRDLLGGQGAPGGASKMHAADPGSGGQGSAAAVLDALRQVLGQATSGVREGAGRIDEATGASQHARDALSRATGQSPEELIARLRELMANNQLATGAALGGLGALILGTGAGRSLAGTAVRLGGLALIGGLAYKAYQNYQQGRPILGGDSPPAPQEVQGAPKGSGFEPDAVTDARARLLIRAMIAAAAADGRIDGSERARIMDGLRQAGIDQAAQQFLSAEIDNPASAEELADAVSSQEEAVQVYTAARIAVDLDSGAEHAFLRTLAEALEIDAALAAQIDAAARSRTP